jgi:tRNA nucleotidyltransferase/poly(A) polymerase
MQIYIVGGYVRDRLLGREAKDHDFVVVGSTPEEMIANGFSQVGADFPVFLHPVSGDEFALARTERKVGNGYTGFEVNADPSVTLEDDLRRRDLTINAMARRVISFNELGHAQLDDEVIDPFNGRADLELQILRHVSPAFAEDPLRVLRVARFAARYDFTVHPSTVALMKRLVNQGQMQHLTSERVWVEVEKAIGEPHPHRFFAVLDEVGALSAINLGSTDVRMEVLARLESATAFKASATARWLLLFHDWPIDRVDRWLRGTHMSSADRRTVLMGAQVHRNILRAASGPVAENMETFFKRFRLNQAENMKTLGEILGEGCKHCCWCSKTSRRVFNVMKEAAAVEVSDPSLEGRAFGEDLKRQRMELFSKYENEL